MQTASCLVSWVQFAIRETAAVRGIRFRASFWEPLERELTRGVGRASAIRGLFSRSEGDGGED
jgi:hypothetical protein